jgi:microcystin-dependent protein
MLYRPVRDLPEPELMKENDMKQRHVIHVLCAALLLFLVSFTAPQRALAFTPFIGEIRWVAFNFAPKGWAQCNGQLLPINQNPALFSLLGTTFGGNGLTTFALPDMRSRAPIHVSPNYTLGGIGGEESHTLTLAEIPAHTHTVTADPREGTAAGPTGNSPAKTSDGTTAYGSSTTAQMAPGSVTNAGGGQAHQNMKPFITLNCIISLAGIFPSQN